jgi:hypothetical protein
MGVIFTQCPFKQVLSPDMIVPSDTENSVQALVIEYQMQSEFKSPVFCQFLLPCQILLP